MIKRIEKDFLGEHELSNDSFYGIHTKRALENFQVSGLVTSIYPQFIIAIAKLKKASAKANNELNMLDDNLANIIIQACDKIIAGEYHNQFVVDPIQGGAGTSMNMNANEVIANIALELMGKSKGDYSVLNPIDHVNLSQSTNDVYPSSIKVATLDCSKDLIAEIKNLIKAFDSKAIEFKDIIKTGRTQLQDAVPMTLGQAFATYSNQLSMSIETIEATHNTLFGLNMGATAIGTGITSHPAYSKTVEKHIKSVIGNDFYIMENLFTGTQDASGFAFVSGGLKRFAVQLSKICNDLRLLSSGPNTGLGEINLPSRQAGSSIMPGKVNPVIPEVVNQVCFQVIGYDTAISFACEGGQLELNAFEPLIANNLFSGMSMLINALKTLRINCVDGITANVDTCLHYAENNISIVTALRNYIGYSNCSKIAKIALKEKKSVYQVTLELGLMEEKQLKELLDLHKMISI